MPYYCVGKRQELSWKWESYEAASALKTKIDTFTYLGSFP